MRHSILVLTNSIAGLHSFRKELIKTIIDSGFDVYISEPDDDLRAQYFTSIGCNILKTNMSRRGKNPFTDLKLLLVYLRIIRSIRPRVVLTYTIKPNIYGGIASRWCHIPQLANITGLGDAIENPGLLSKFTIALYRLGLKKAKTVFYQNASIEEFCIKHRIGRLGRLLPGSGVNLDWHTLKAYPADGSTMKFNFIGRVLKDKGIEEFFEMARTIRAKYPFVEFHILGDCEGAYETQLRGLQKDGTIVWHGAVTDVRPYIEDSYATIHPSYHEGMANVILETCAAGRPVIACNINGCKEAIDDGVNGFLCRVRDAVDLAEKVERFIMLPYERKVQLGLNAREKMKREFDRKIVIEAYLEEIEDI